MNSSKFPRLIPAGNPALLMLMGGLLLAVGCGREVRAPQPIPMEQLPAALRKAFGHTAPETQALVQQVVGFVQATNPSQAFLVMQNLVQQPGLTAEQTTVLTRGLLTLNSALQTAQGQGNQAAAQTLKFYRENK